MGERVEQIGDCALHLGDCIEVLPTLGLVDAVVTDPPYHLTSIVKRFGKADSAPVKPGKTGAYARASKGFMGQTWDGGDIAFRPELWRLVYDAMKPGAHLLSFSGCRTYHRMASAIEEAGFEIRDTVHWMFGSGFPKSHNAGDGWGTALKPAHELICLARKPLIGTVAQNMQKHGTGALNIDGCRTDDAAMSWETPRGGIWKTDPDAKSKLSTNTKGRWPANVIHDGLSEEWARFFYSAKANREDRDDGCIEDDVKNNHPTVKPTDLMRYLARLITPPGGTILDPFMGSGSTGRAARFEGFKFIGIEKSPEYFDIACQRIRKAYDQPDLFIEQAKEAAE